MKTFALFALLTVCASSTAPTEAQSLTLPKILEDWREWVLYRQEFRRCPVLQGSMPGQRQDHICAWPGRLRIVVNDQGGRFEMAWQVWEESWIPLPGGAQTWPLDVRVGAMQANVSLAANQPRIRLPAGEHIVVGRFGWQRKPEFIQVPMAVSLIGLELDGQRVDGLVRRGRQLWLGEGQAAEDEREADTATVRVERKIADNVPLRLTTRVKLEVSGLPREALLGIPLPEGFVVTAWESELPLRVDSNQRVILQLRPGYWDITLDARAVALPSSLHMPKPEGLWPANEVWSFQANPRLRVVDIEGAQAIDPQQALMSSDWQHLPTYLMRPDDTLMPVERSRGLAIDEGNQIALQRSMWLDFDGSAYTVLDRISGSMRHAWRIDMQTPMRMTAATVDDAPRLVTDGPLSGATGVEVRNAQLDLLIDGRLESLSKQLPVSGYEQVMDSVSTQLNLPPGYHLLAALNADYAHGSWIERWHLLDLFLLLITAAVYWRLFNPWIGIAIAAYLILSYHESGAPVWTLLILGACVGSMHYLSGWPRKALVILRNLTLLTATLIAVPFIASQLRSTIYPQLEKAHSRMPAPAMSGDAMPASMSPPAAPQRMQNQIAAEMEMEEIVVLAAKLNEPLSLYAPGALVQTGEGRPSWQWNAYRLSWSGPVTAQQNTRMIIAQPWLTRSLRVLSVILLALILGRILHASFNPNWWRRLLATALLSLAGGIASADEIPSKAVLEQLRDRLLPIPECMPDCGVIASAHIDMDPDTLGIRLIAHAAAQVALPLPIATLPWQWQTIELNGQPRAWVYRDGQGTPWFALPPGIHEIHISGPSPKGDNFTLEFPASPQFIALTLKEWEATGVANNRLAAQGIDFLRLQTQAAATEFSANPPRPPTFVMVEREFALDLDWKITTAVQRVAPLDGSFSVTLPLWSEEAVTSSDFGEVVDGSIVLSFPPDVETVYWISRLEPVTRLDLQAADTDRFSEVWRLQISPIWHADIAGIPVAIPSSEDDSFWSLDYYPRRGENLSLTVSRPSAIAGQAIAIDAVSYAISVGQRATEANLNLNLRATRADRHNIRLPANATIQSVTLNGQRSLNLRNEDGLLRLPIAPGDQEIRVTWRSDQGARFATRLPPVDLATNASNVRLSMSLPANRWILLTQGPRLGPAVLYWGELLVMLLVAWGLSRTRQTPLRFRHWFLLGIGFSTVSWSACLLVIVWLFVMAWRRGRHLQQEPPWRFNLLQLALVAMSCLALLALVSAIPYGLLSQPDMHIAGNSGYDKTFSWFADRSDGSLPMPLAISVPLWWYKGAMLIWALWLSSALLRWIPWVWSCLSAGSFWQGRVKPASQTTTPT